MNTEIDVWAARSPIIRGMARGDVEAEAAESEVTSVESANTETVSRLVASISSID